MNFCSRHTTPAPSAVVSRCSIWLRMPVSLKRLQRRPWLCFASNSPWVHQKSMGSWSFGMRQARRGNEDFQLHRRIAAVPLYPWSYRLTVVDHSQRPATYCRRNPWNNYLWRIWRLGIKEWPGRHIALTRGYFLQVTINLKALYLMRLFIAQIHEN